ncbi:hypothetical protein F975_01003 [Acinetobacter sp. ANC 3789]|uniref:LA2681 family HEPN domain-containing protein n=1 Tax=Acinetobacter sp. ANC 3789 TaxID=1217714 RepID=UPI0002CE9DD1|nr:LA2681 family HEPN domain-containing protein [Acinetobacter sp. ANC 3789]ENU81142.1 hypothetical protein F975_01003 [Acinetobacter sp. ANC 3789]
MMKLGIKQLKELAKLADKLLLDENRKNELITFFNIQIETLFIFESDFCKGYFYYILGNCSSVIYRYQSENWYSQDLINTVNLYQKAVYFLRKEKNATDLLSFALTNLGNFLSSQGRCFCAQHYWDDAIKIDENPVAVIAKATNILFRTEQLYDDSNNEVYYFFANQLITQAYKKIDFLEREQKIPLQQGHLLYVFHQWYGQNFKENEFNYLKEYKQKTSTKTEYRYLNWVAKNKLFLNELNDLLNEEMVFQDTLEISSMSYKINTSLSLKEELVFYSNFDELRNEYTYARFLIFQASEIKEDSEHFYNKTYSHIDDTLHAIDNLKTSQMKSAFRILYSIFDKISYFIAKYFGLSITDHEISFKGIFYEGRLDKIRNRFFESENCFLHALFYILKEIEVEPKRKSKDSIENMNKIENLSNLEKHRLAKIRNHLEHRSFRIVDDFGYELNTKYNSSEEFRYQELLVRKDELEKNNLQSSDEYIEVINNLKEKEIKSKYILEMPLSEFEESLMHLTRLARNSLMYLSLLVQYEEKNKPRDGKLVLEREVPLK